jgi:hypothetical protein
LRNPCHSCKPSGPITHFVPCPVLGSSTQVWPAMCNGHHTGKLHRLTQSSDCAEGFSKVGEFLGGCPRACCGAYSSWLEPV